MAGDRWKKHISLADLIVRPVDRIGQHSMVESNRLIAILSNSLCGRAQMSSKMTALKIRMPFRVDSHPILMNPLSVQSGRIYVYILLLYQMLNTFDTK